MIWPSVSAFFHMGGYGFYVWGAYGVTFALLAIEALSLVGRERSTVSSLRRELDRGEPR